MSHFEIFKATYLDTQEPAAVKDTATVAPARRPTYEELANKLGVSATDIRNRLMFARAEFRRILRALVREYTLTHDDVEEELRYLMSV